MAQVMNEAEQEHVRAIVSKIATHIVEGSAAVQELKSFVARLKNTRCDVEYAIYEHWLKAAKIIEAAGKDKSSWATFMNSLNVNYGNDNKDTQAAWGWGAGDEANIFSNASKELWTYDKTQDFSEEPGMGHGLMEPVTYNYQVNPADKGYQFNPESELSFVSSWDTAPVAMTAREPDVFKSRGKRKWEDSSEGDGVDGKQKKHVQFTDGRKLGGEQVFALKKSGKCFYCERKGHRAVDCKDNPDVQGKL